MNKKVPPATQAGSPGKFQTAVLWYQFIKRNFRAIQGLRKLDAMRSILVRANVELGKLAWDDPVYAQRIKEFDAAMIESMQGKWLMAQAMESGSKENWKQAFRHMATAHRLGVWIHRSLCSGSSQPIPLPHHQLHQPNAEILFADGVPLVPAINPVVILQGSDYDMGYQYAQQVIEIFGGWIMQKKAAQTFTPEEVESAWCMAVINRHPPAQLLPHSDRGSQYTSEVYLNLLQAAQCQISMSRTGNCYDNAAMESFFATLKGECANRRFSTKPEARSAIFEYIEVWYNRQRLHSSLGYLTPMQFEQLSGH